MSDTAKQLLESLRSVKDAAQQIAPGLKDLIPDIKAEFSRMGTQGSMELASALFNGSAFVPYGPGQYTPSPEHESPAQELGQEREMGMER